jgi:hypothetical protein
VSTALLDEWLPHFQVSARYSILVRASPGATYAALVSANFSQLTLVRRLMRLRGYRLGGSEVTTPNSPERSLRGAFLDLAVVSDKEVLLGIAGRFWRPDGGIVHGLTSIAFRDFQQDGYAKAVWNFSLTAVNESTQLSTETRIQTFGRSATLKFQLYWFAVGPFSGLIRRAMLREVRRIAEHPST